MKYEKVMIIGMCLIISGATLWKFGQSFGIEDGYQTTVNEHIYKQDEIQEAKYQGIRKYNYVYSKYEPVFGTYLGSYTLSNKFINYSAKEMDELVGKKHLMNMYFVRIGDEIPREWLVESLSMKKVPFITLLHVNNHGEEEFDELLVKTLRSLADYHEPVFINISQWGHEIKSIAYHIRENIPTSSIVFSLTMDQWIEDYFQVVDVLDMVDWCGLKWMIEDPKEIDSQLAKLKEFYCLYQNKKPIYISELAVVNYYNKDHRYVTDEAGKGITDIYDTVEGLRRIKGINYMNVHVTDDQLIKGVYAITENKSLRNMYSQAIQPSIYITEMDKSATIYRDGVIDQVSNLNLIVYEGESHIQEGDFIKRNFINVENLTKVVFNDRIFYPLSEIASKLGSQIKIDHQTRLVRFMN